MVERPGTFFKLPGRSPSSDSSKIWFGFLGATFPLGHISGFSISSIVGDLLLVQDFETSYNKDI